MLKIRQFDPRWTLPSRMDENPRAWMIEINGFVVDARHLKREFQEEAFRRGLIPYIPDERADVLGRGVNHGPHEEGIRSTLASGSGTRFGSSRA